MQYVNYVRLKCSCSYQNNDFIIYVLLKFVLNILNIVKFYCLYDNFIL